MICILENAIQLYTEKIAGYARGYGTVLFFEDTAVVDGFAAKIPSYVQLLKNAFLAPKYSMIQPVEWRHNSLSGH